MICMSIYSSSRLCQPFTDFRSIHTSVSFQAKLCFILHLYKYRYDSKIGILNLIRICQANYLCLLYENLVLTRKRYANWQNWHMLTNRYFASTCSKRLSYVYFLFLFDLKAVQKCQYKFTMSWTCRISVIFTQKLVKTNKTCQIKIHSLITS